MSDADSFIREVTDEVRRDRLFRLWRRWGPFVIGGVVAVVVVTAVLAWLESRAEAAAREAGGRLIEAAQSERPAERLLAEADALDEGAATLARLQAAAALAAGGEDERAAALYAEVAEGAAAPQAIVEFATYRAALLGAEAGDVAAAQAGLDALIRPDSAWRLLALEARGSLRLSQGDPTGAAEDFRAALEDPGATDALRERLGALLDAAEARGGA